MPLKDMKQASRNEVFNEYDDFGLRIILEKPQLEALEIDVTRQVVGHEVSIIAKAKITGIKKECLDLQITEMDLTDEESAEAAFKEAFK